MGIFWGVLTGLFLAGGNFFMSRAAQSITFSGDLKAVIIDAAQNRPLYLSVMFNFCATLSYLLCLRQKQLIDGFAITTVTVSAAVFLLSIALARAQPSGIQMIGFLMAVTGVVLMNRT